MNSTTKLERVTNRVRSRILIIPSFKATKLDNYRDIFVYLPPSYSDQQDTRYPVMYMHDGQNIFKPADVSRESWNVHTTVDRMVSSGRIREIIVVGVPNMGSERWNEYMHDAPSDFFVNVVPKGDLYEDFLVNELKPYIDSHFRTLSAAKHTALVGSSMGGLVTYNIGFRNPQTFGLLGILSPYFVATNPRTLQESVLYQMYSAPHPGKVWIDIGGMEGLIRVDHVKQIVRSLLAQGMKYEDQVVFLQDINALHSERFWEHRMTSALQYFFGHKGHLISAEMNGINQVGISGMETEINTVLTFDSGLVISDLNGKYDVENTNIIDVKPDGQIGARSVGTTRVIYRREGIQTARTYSVRDYVEEFVTVSVHISVPSSTPSNASIFCGGIEIPATERNTYSRNFRVRRGSGFDFGVSQSIHVHEVTHDGNRIHRSCVVDDDLTLDIEVQAWSDTVSSNHSDTTH